MPQLLRHLIHLCGWIALALAAIGLVLPLVPTVPFLLLAAACFMRSSDRAYRWLVTNPAFGCHISDYREGRGVRPRAKVAALVSLWASVLVSVVFFVPLIIADVIMLVTAAVVSAYLLRLPSCRT